MKKLLTIVLALALVFSVCSFASAFTGIDDPEDTNKLYDIKIELVDYLYGWKDGIYYVAAPDRGYLVNEVVGAVITVNLPAKPTDVRLKVTAKDMEILDVDNETRGTRVWELREWERRNTNEWYTRILRNDSSKEDRTLKFFVTAQLKSLNGGSITATLQDIIDTYELSSTGPSISIIGSNPSPMPSPIPSPLPADFYVKPYVGRYNGSYSGFTVTKGGSEYAIWFAANKYHIQALDNSDAKVGDQLIIEVNSSNFTKGMKVRSFGLDAEFTVTNVGSGIAFKDPTSNTLVYHTNSPVAATDGNNLGKGDKAVFEELEKIYNQISKAFSLNWFDGNGYLYDSFFYNNSGSVTVSDTAYVEPSLPSDTLVPDIDVGIPQTGAVSFVGFAMIALAMAAAVAVKKAR